MKFRPFAKGFNPPDPERGRKLIIAVNHLAKHGMILQADPLLGFRKLLVSFRKMHENPWRPGKKSLPQGLTRCVASAFYKISGPTSRCSGAHPTRFQHPTKNVIYLINQFRMRPTVRGNSWCWNFSWDCLLSFPKNVKCGKSKLLVRDPGSP